MANRRLSSIMFVDIAGYTALMQQDEQEALIKVKRFRKILEEISPSFDGKIVQYYGDGSLLIFQSSVEAVRCAKEIQLEARKLPIIPIRIGIHLGDIVIEDENIFGDGVNIASRVESLGIPGAVLMSHQVFKEVQNHPDLRTISLGEFHFKNVKEPSLVYALQDEGLIIPKPEQMKGKLQAPTKRKSKASWVSVLSILALLLGITGYSLKDFFQGKEENTGEDTLSLTIFVHGPEGKQDIVLSSKGRILADFGNDRRAAQIGENGRTVFSEIPEKMGRKKTLLSIEAEGFELRYPDSSYFLTEGPIYIELLPKTEMVSMNGQVLKEDSLEPIAGARIMVEGIAAITDSLGNYTLKLPKRQKGFLYKHIITKKGYLPLNERRAIVNHRIEFRLEENRN